MWNHLVRAAALGANYLLQQQKAGRHREPAEGPAAVAGGTMGPGRSYQWCAVPKAKAYTVRGNPDVYDAESFMEIVRQAILRDTARLHRREHETLMFNCCQLIEKYPHCVIFVTKTES